MQFDYFLEKRLKQGKFQNIQIFCTGSTYLCNQLVYTYYLIQIPILGKQLNLNSLQFSLIPFLMIMGQSLGCFLSSYFDSWGRKKTIILSLFLTVLLMVISNHIQESFTVAVLLRTLIFLFNGISFNIVCIYSSEISTKNYRGRLMVTLQIFGEVGSIILSATALFYLIDFYNGNWYGMSLTIESISVLICGIIMVIQRESPRILLNYKLFCQTFQEIQFIGQENHGTFQLTNQEV